jgi:predicted phage terminase large subunit-like protein
MIANVVERKGRAVALDGAGKKITGIPYETRNNALANNQDLKLTYFHDGRRRWVRVDKPKPIEEIKRTIKLPDPPEKRPSRETPVVQKNETVAPQTGPQSQFMSTDADIAIYGGAAGGGKTWALLLDLLRWYRDPNYHAIVFRRTYDELRGSNGLFTTACELYGALGGRPNKSTFVIDFPYFYPDGSADAKKRGASIKFTHLQHEDDVHKHDGKEYSIIAFDELATFTEYQFDYMRSRLRSKARFVPYIRCTTNPEDPNIGEPWLRKFVYWWIDPHTGYPIPDRAGKTRYFIREGSDYIFGDSKQELISDYPGLFAGLKVHPETIIKSLTFIPAKVTDNMKLLERNPEYIGTLSTMPERERKRLLDGCWNVSSEKGGYFDRKNIIIREAEGIPKDFDRMVRCWDLAETEPDSKVQHRKDPDYTVGLLAGWSNATKIMYVLDIERFRHGPAEVERKVRDITEKDAHIWGLVETHIERVPVGGQTIIEHYNRLLSGFPVYDHKHQLPKIKRAVPVSAAVEKHRVIFKNAIWNSALISEAESFGLKNARHDDQVDTLAMAYNVFNGPRRTGLGASILI